MAKHLLWLALMVLVLAACDAATESAPTSTSSAIPPTASATPVPPPTDLPFVNPTLPPAATIALSGADPRATRTPAPSITPAPSATSNLNPRITPQTESESPAEDEAAPVVDGDSLRFVVGWDDLSRTLQALSPLTTVVKSSQQFSFNDSGAVVLSFDLIDGAQTTTISANVTLEYLNDRVFGGLTTATANNQPYSGEPLFALSEQVQIALDQAIQEKVLIAIGEGRPFAVTEFSFSAAGLSITAVYQQ